MLRIVRSWSRLEGSMKQQNSGKPAFLSSICAALFTPAADPHQLNGTGLVISPLLSSVCAALYHQLLILINQMAQVQVVTNAFEPKTLNQLLRKLEFVSFDQSAANVMRELEELTADDYLWAVCKDPVYFIQYQVRSAAVLRVRQHVLLVWKPKYIEYPSIHQVPEMKDKKPANLSIEFLPGSKTTEETNGFLRTFLEAFYVTYFHTDDNFETKLVSNLKHLITGVTKHSYWHVIMDRSGCTEVTRGAKMMNECRVRVTGIKEGYDQTILLFAYQGKRNDFFATAKNKWMQVVSFLAMFMVFYSVTACSADSQEGICQYRQQMSMAGTIAMLGLMSLRFVKDKQKNKKRKAKKETQAKDD